MGVLSAQLVGFAWWVLQTSIQTSIVIGLVLTAQWLFEKKLAPRWRYCLWLLILARLLLPMVPTSPFSIFNYTQGVKVLALADAGSAASLAPPAASRVVTRVDSMVSPAAAPGRAATEFQADVSPGPDVVDSSGGQAAAALRTPWPWPLLLSLLWLGGALLLLTRILWFAWQLNAQLARQETAARPEVFGVLEQAKRIMGVRQVLPIVQSRAVSSPALMGCIRPWLLLPEGMVKGFTVAELRFVFLHELAHLRRRDIAVNWIMTVAQILHWFNPLVWFAFTRMRADRELACDELALSYALAEENRSYGQAIIKLLEGSCRPAVLPGLAGILEDRQQMKRRITMIAQFERTAGRPVLAAVLAMALGLVLLTDAQTSKGGEQLSRARVSRRDRTPPAGSAGLPIYSRPAGQQEVLSLRTLPVPEEFLWGETVVSGDGRYLVAGCWNPKRTEVLDLAHGTVRTVTNLVVYWPKFSPNNREIAATGYVDTESTNHIMNNEIVLLDLKSLKTRRLYQNAESDYIKITDWSSDGRTILFIFKKADQKRSWHIATLAVADGSTRVVKSLERWASFFEGTMSFSPDGRWVVYDAPDGTNDNSPRDLYLVSSDGSEEVSLVRHPADDFVLGWAASGDQVLFASNRRGTWDAFSLRVRDGRPIGEPELVKEAIGHCRALGLTRDGTLFYRLEMRSKDLYVAALDAASGRIQGPPAKVPSSFEGHIEFPAWSDDGRFLSYATTAPGPGAPTGSSLICIRDLRDGTDRQLKVEGGRFWMPRWSPDGTRFIASGIERQRYAFFELDRQSGTSHLLPIRPGTSTLTGWAPDGRAFYYQQHRAIVRRELLSGAETRFPMTTNALGIAYDEHTPAILSHDAQQIAFRWDSATDAQTIQVMPLRGGPPRQVAAVKGPDFIDSYFVAWTPDDRYVLFTKSAWGDYQAASTSLWRAPVTGGAAEPLGDLPPGSTELRLAPDGLHLAFTVSKSKRDIWVLENFLPRSKVARK